MNGWQCPRCGACYAPFIAECCRCNSSGGIQSTTGTAEFPCLHPSLITDSAGVHCAYCGKRILTSQPSIITCMENHPPAPNVTASAKKEME